MFEQYCEEFINAIVSLLEDADKFQKKQRLYIEDHIINCATCQTILNKYKNIDLLSS
ncbi:hypothetical protein [Bacillus sp. JJ722]|uniref:hypothetical protein n=1 Tax=Bacillus sp. JJ722 TaxID=3122973 RepID=UPI002FFE950A